MSETSFDYDLFVIGAGSGGVRAARRSAQYGASVAVAEERHLGGTCVNLGCVPKKLLVYAAGYAEHLEDAAGYGWSIGEATHDWPTLIARKDRHIEKLNGIYRTLLENAGVDLFEQRAELIDAHTLDVGGERITARRILIATGSRPVVPDIPGNEHAITSDEAFHLKALPEHVTIVGGGYIAVEFASILQHLGAQVTQLYRRDLFLRGFDDDLRTGLAEQLPKKGIDLRFNTNATRIRKHRGGSLEVELTGGGTIRTGAVLFATGREPNTAGLGLDRAGVELGEHGAVPVDEYSQSAVESICAVGDVTDRVPLTPVAIAEGEALARTLFRDEPTPMRYANIPSAVFSLPPVGTVGLTEAEARHRHEVDIYRTDFRPMKHALTGRDERMLIKLIVDRATDRVLGAHLLGEDAPEIVQAVAVALQCGATKAQFDSTIALHPTSAEEMVTMRQPVGDERPAARQ